MASVWVQRRSRQHLPLSLHQVAAYISTQFVLTRLLKCCAPYTLYSYIITRTSRAQLSSFESINIYRQSDHPAPSEMAELLDLPQELLDHVADCIPLSDRRTLLNLALTCQRLNASSSRRLYSSIHYTSEKDFSDKTLQRIVSTLSIERHLGSYVRSLSLSDWQKQWPTLTWEHRYMEKGSTQVVRQPAGLFFLAQTPNLRNLTIAYPVGCTFLDQKLPRLETCCVRPEGSAFAITELPASRPVPRARRHVSVAQPYRPCWEMLDLTFLPELLKSPRLKILRIESAFLDQRDFLQQNSMPLRSSTISRLGSPCSASTRSWSRAATVPTTVSRFRSESGSMPQSDMVYRTQNPEA